MVSRRKREFADLRGLRVYVRTGVVPTGLADLFHFTRQCRAGLSHRAATRLQFWWCLLERLRSKVVLTQSLKPGFNGAMQDTDKAAPVQTLHETSWQVLDLLGRTVAHGEPVEEGQGDSDKQDQRFVVLDLRQQSGADQHSDDAEKSSPAELEKRPFWAFFP
jgi:hypothetical protein